MGLSNYHTHSTYCDGKNTPRDIVKKAIELGMSDIGFSGHSYTETNDKTPYSMTRDSTKRYKAEILALGEEYKDKIRVHLGVEQDYFAPDGTDGYEYVIGSVHYVKKDGVFLPVDESREAQTDAVMRYYGGDFYAFCEDYYALVGDVFEKTACDIVGHFDLVTKFNEGNVLFDTNHPRYRAAADRALEKLMGHGLYFEINYGAIARGARKTPYPEPRLLSRLLENGEKILYSSDCHDVNFLLFGIEKENDFRPRKRL